MVSRRKETINVYMEVTMRAILYALCATAGLLQGHLMAQEAPVECLPRPVYLNPQIYENSTIYNSYDVEGDNLKRSFPSNHNSSFYDELTR